MARGRCLSYLGVGALGGKGGGKGVVQHTAIFLGGVTHRARVIARSIDTLGRDFGK